MTRSTPFPACALLAAHSGESVAIGRVAKLASPVVMASPVLKIATFHSSSLKSLLVSLPALVALRDSFPGARICSFARAPLLPILENFSGVDEAHARPGGGLSSQAALLARLHGGSYDLALSFSQGSNALLLMWATGAPIRAGFIPSRMDALLTHKTAKTGPLRIADGLELVRAVGATPRGERAHDFLHIAPEITASAVKLREEAGIARDFLLVCVEPHKNGEEKQIFVGEEAAAPVAAATLRELSQFFDLVLVGLRPKGALIREIGDTPHKILDLGGKTDVLTLTALCEMSRGVFGVGGGVLQLGKFYEKPVVAPHLGESHAETALRARQTFGF